MTTVSGDHANPFSDSAVVEDSREFVAASTLPVGRNASLTLGTDSLIVLDEALARKEPWNCCGLLPSRSKTTRAVPFFNILWAELSDFELTIHHAHPISKNVVRVAFINYNVEKTDRALAATWTERLLDRAYGASQRRKRVKVLVNPFGGKGSAAKWYTRDIEPIFAAAKCEIDVERTQYNGHAVEIAERLDTSAWDVVACCSGDGVPHEVFNGLGKKQDAAQALADVAVVQLPCGSGNAMSLNLNGTDSPSLAALCVVKGLKTPLDLVSITQSDRRTLSFLSQSVGIIAESDLGTDNLRWMGSARFTVGFLVRLLGKTTYPCDIAIQLENGDKNSIKASYRRERDSTAPPPSSRRSDAQQQQQASLVEPDPSSTTPSSAPRSGLPPLRFGTINDPLPASWTMTPHPRLGNFYAGNMSYMAASTPIFPCALPADGCLDLVTLQGDIGRVAALRSFLSVESGRFMDSDLVTYAKIAAFRIIPRSAGRQGGRLGRLMERAGVVKRRGEGRKEEEGYISIDGERVPFEPFQAEVHRGLGTVLSRGGRVYEGDLVH
ncbi:MAG: sphinganine kinase lcb4 [Bathelium mastoideum]|nr:MAG: sphinganine kinase lcb4 [Bathelium mastoideum]